MSKDFIRLNLIIFGCFWKLKKNRSRCKSMCKLLSIFEYPRDAFAGVVARVVVEPSRDIEFLRGRMAETERQVEGLFESMLVEAFS